MLDGRVHFNDTPSLNASGATFLTGFETSEPACKTATSPAYLACLRSGSGTPVYGTTGAVVPPRYADPLYLDDTSAKFATYPGCHYYGATRIKFNASPAGTMTVFSKDSAGKATGTGCGTFTAANSYTRSNLAVPNDQVIYVSAGRAVHRCLSGRSATVCRSAPTPGTATPQYTYDQSDAHQRPVLRQGQPLRRGHRQGPRDASRPRTPIVVTGDLVLANGINGTDLVGLVAGNSVEVYHPWMDTWQKNSSNRVGLGGRGAEDSGTWPTRYNDPGQSPASPYPTSGIQIDASIQTLQHSFFVQQYNQGPGEGTLIRLGLHRPALARHRGHGQRRQPDRLHQVVQLRRAPEVLLAAVLPAVVERQVGDETHR